MKITLNIGHKIERILTNVLETAFNQKLETIMTNTEIALADLVAIRALCETQNATIAKIGRETSTLLQKITDLEASAPADTPQSVLDAIAEIKIGAQIVLDNMTAVDNQVPDSPQ